nr:unnamed protein product [Callosobruchus chinensis]
MADQKTKAQQQRPANQASTNSSETKRPGIRSAKKRVKAKNAIEWRTFIFLLGNIAMVMVGLQAFGKCPAEPYIPFYLVSFGFLGCLSKYIKTLKQWAGGKYAKSIEAERMLNAALATLFIFGTFWVNNVYLPSYDPNDGEKYCEPLAYMFAFTFNMGICIVMLTTLAILPCVLLCICYFRQKFRKRVDVEANLREEEKGSLGKEAELVSTVVICKS